MEPRPRPLAYHLSWTTYGTWLPGDARGWIEAGTHGIQDPDPNRENSARRRLKERVVELDPAQRKIVQKTIEAHAAIRGWRLHAVDARTNHVHVVVTAEMDPETVMNQFKAWCSRRLNENGPKRRRWWTHHGSTKWINDEEYLLNTIEYVLEKQG